MNVTHLDGSYPSSIIEGADYLVPCVFGIPVICPSHVDDGAEGPTGRHWHTDDRFGTVRREFEFWHPDTQTEMKMLDGDYLRSDILGDSGQLVVMERKTAAKSVMYPSGSVFSSLVWLYHTLGKENAKDNHCAHHRTPLVEQDGCLTCPAHGLKYKHDGSPRYNAPFFLSTRYIDWDNQIKRVCEPICQEGKKLVVHMSIEGTFDLFPLIQLEDVDGEYIMTCRAETSVHQAKKGTSTLDISINAWPSTGKCARLVESDPRT